MGNHGNLNLPPKFGPLTDKRVIMTYCKQRDDPRFKHIRDGLIRKGKSYGLDLPRMRRTS